MIIYAKVIPYMDSAFKASASVSAGMNFQVPVVIIIYRGRDNI